MRAAGLSATDMTVIAGVTPYGRTVHDVYLSKLGLEEEREQTSAMSLGHRLEPVALALLSDERSLTITPGTTEQHPIMTWAVATPDGNVLDAPDGQRIAVAEAKAVGLRMASRWGENGDDETIPDEVRVQVAWQMIVTRVKRAHVVALIGTEARFYDVEHDDDLATALLEMGDTFWRKHVLTKVAPPIDGSESAAAMVRQLFRRASAPLIDAPAEAEQLVHDYLAAKEALDAAETRKRAAQAKLEAMIGEHEGLRGADWIATWKERAGSPDYKALAEKLGATKALIEQYRREGSRVLNVKTTKREAA